MNKKLLAWLLTFCALGLGGSAAYYSIIGLSKLFAGVAFAVIIMASFLEASKLTLAVLLHTYWGKLHIFAKIYLPISLMVLSIITSMGIYGMLSSGYEEIASKSLIIDNKIGFIEERKKNVEGQLASYINDNSLISNDITQLRTGLSNNVIQYTDANTGQIITTTSTATRKSLENQLQQSLTKQNKITNKIDSLNFNIFKINEELIVIKSDNDLSVELGPLKYISRSLDIEMDKVVNYLLLLIIFVFDPLALSLVLAASFSFKQINNSKKNMKKQPKIEKEKGIDIPKEELLIPQTNEGPEGKEGHNCPKGEKGDEGVDGINKVPVEEEVVTPKPKKETKSKKGKELTQEEIVKKIENDPNLAKTTKKGLIRKYLNGREDLVKHYF